MIFAYVFVSKCINMQANASKCKQTQANYGKSKLMQPNATKCFHARQQAASPELAQRAVNRGA